MLSQELVLFSGDDMPWADLKGLPGARGFEFKAVTSDAYTTRRIATSLFAWSLATTPCHNRAGEPPLYILTNPGNMSGKTMDGCKAPVTSQSTAAPLQSGSGAACQVRAGEKHSPRNLDDDSPFWLSTIRHASERRIKTLAALPGGNPAPRKPHRADHGLPRQGARRRGHSARPTTCSAMRAQGNSGFRLSARVLCRKPQFNEPSEGLPSD